MECECGQELNIYGQGHCKKHHLNFGVLNQKNSGCPQCIKETTATEVIDMWSKNAVLESRIAELEQRNRALVEALRTISNGQYSGASFLAMQALKEAEDAGK